MEWIVRFGALIVILAGAAACLVTVFGGRWLVWWHGEGEAWQYQFYRCPACRHIVTHRHILVGGCACHETSKISPAKLTLLEKARLLYAPWTVTPLSVVYKSRPYQAIQRAAAAEVLRLQAEKAAAEEATHE